MSSQFPGSVRSDAILQPQATKSFQNTSFPSLVNSHATFVFPEDSLINSTSSRDPTLEQAQAIETLRYYHSSDVIAWHTLSQSTEPALRHRDGPGGLSIQEVHAISVLSNCSRENILHWFKSANRKAPPKSSLSIHRFATAASSRQTRPPSPRSDHTSAHLSLLKSVKAIPHLSENPYSALTTIHSPLTPAQTVLPASAHKTSALARPANPNHTYWCTVCGDRSYKKSDDWKKHEKEHEIKYVCLLEGLFEPTEVGQKCVLCGVLDPADTHHLAHKIAPCSEAANRPSFKRRYEMVGHLKEAHDISKGGTIADKWRSKSPKKAWSCGFCVQLFPSLQARLRHIGTEHFEQGQSISDWDTTKLIQGLLLQAGIQEAWQSLLDSHDPFRLSEIKWNKLGSEDLQQRLERGLVGKETPQSLAKAAYDNAEYDWSLADIDDTAFATNMTTEHTRCISKTSSPLSPEHAVASREGPVEYQPWIPPQQQVSQIPTTSPTSKAQSVYVTAASMPPLAHLAPALDNRWVCKALASDTNAMNSTWPTKPSNDQFDSTNPSVSTPWSGYNTTPEPTYSDQVTFHYKCNDDVAWSVIPHPHIDFGPSTLKRPRESAAPPADALPRKSSLKDWPGKKRYRKTFGEEDKASRTLGLDYGQRRTYDDEDA